jgi:hypothetical protein
LAHVEQARRLDSTPESVRVRLRTRLPALTCAFIVGCAPDPVDNTVDGGISTAENCLDGIDNDTDGFIDCSDQDCAQAGA